MGDAKRYRLGGADVLTVRQARDLAERQAARATTGVDLQIVRQQDRLATQQAVLQTLSGFLEQKYGPWVIAKQRRAEETLQRLRYNFASLLEKPMHEITPWIIEKWRAEQIKQGKAPSTVNRDVTTLRSVLSQAVDWEVLDTHPLGKLKPLSVDKTATVRYLSEDETIRLRTALAHRDDRIKDSRERGNAWRRERGYAELPSHTTRTYGDHLAPMVLLSLNTGLRRGEVFNLTWHDVDFSSAHLTVQGAGAKSGQTRHIPLNPEALALLRTWRQQSSGDELIFPGQDGNRLNNIKKAWTGLLKEAGIANFRWHDLRHDFASKLVMAGVPLNTVRDLLGHSDLSTTLRYAHLAPDHKAEAVNRLCPPLSIPLNKQRA